MDKDSRQARIAADGLTFKPAVLVAQLAETLIQAIKNGTFKGGEQLIEAELEKRFGISRTPLREAFRELEKKGFVRVLPRKGTFVKSLSPKDAEDVYVIRANLEGLAGRRAFKRFTGEDRQALQDCLDAMERANAERDTEAFLDHHIRYHDIYINACGNAELIDILAKLRGQTDWHRYFFKFHDKHFEDTLATHRAIHRLFTSPDASAAQIERAIRAHILKGFRRFRRHLKETAGAVPDPGDHSGA